MSEHLPASSPEDRVHAIAEQFFQALLAGKSPIRTEWVARYPEHAPMLGERLEAIERMHIAFEEPAGAAKRGGAGAEPKNSDATTDRNLLFGALAFQNEYIDLAQFAAVCRVWAADKSRAMAELLVERGWITATVRAVLDEIVERKLKRYGGDAHATLGAVADGGVRDAIRDAGDSSLAQSISSLPPAAGHVLVEAVNVGGPLREPLPHAQREDYSEPAAGRSRYTLTRLHAAGGLGQVWLAHDRDLNRDVALKELKPTQTDHPEVWRRFIKEAQITGQLEHPNIVPVYELARRPGDDQPFYTMRFVRGQTLRDAIMEYHRSRRVRSGGVRIEEKGPRLAKPESGEAAPHDSAFPSHSPTPHSSLLDFRRLLNAFISICHAIAYAHSRGVVHRDLKLANVVLGGFGEVLVLDWGLAKVAGATDADAPTIGISDSAQAAATQTGALLGTPEYMAPEQAEGRAELIDARTDIYGLGGILFAILTGQAPRRGKDTGEVLSQLLDSPTPRVRSADPGAPAALDAICARAMAKERADRYATASELAAEVERYLADEPVAAYREPLPARLGRWTRRHRTGTQAAAVILLAVTLVSVVAMVLVNGHRRIAETARDRADAKERESRQQLYVISMNLAQAAWEDGLTAATLDQLKRFAPGSGNENLRGFEWFYWNRLCHSYLNELRGHKASVHCVTFSPDGRRLASGSFDGTVKIWDAATGAELSTLKGHANWVTSVAFSPSGFQLASASSDGTVKLWDITNGHELHTLRGHTGYVWSVAFSPDGRSLASASDDQTLKLWNVMEGREKQTLNGHTQFLTSVTFSPNGSLLASAAYDQTVRLWDSANGEEILTLKGHESAVRSVAFSLDGQRLATASNDQTIRVWDTKTGELQLTWRGHTDGVMSAVFSPNGWQVASGGLDSTVKIWDAKSGKELHSFGGHTDEINCVVYSPDGRRFATASDDGTIKIWNAVGEQEYPPMSALDNWNWGIPYFGSGLALPMSSHFIRDESDLNTVKVTLPWNTQQMVTLRGHTSVVNCVEYSQDFQRLATASDDGTVRVWDVTSGQESLVLTGHAGRVWSVVFSPNGQRLASSGSDGTVKLWDLTTGQETLTISRLTDSPAIIGFSPDGQQLAYCKAIQFHESARLEYVWDARPWTPELKAEQEASGLVRFLIAKRPGKDELIESIRGDATISEPVRRRALELAETFWVRENLTQRRKDAKEE